MSSPTNQVQTQAGMTQGYIEQAADLLVKASEQSDTATGLGIDDRIKLGHSLVDLWVKSYAALLQGWISGPYFGTGQAATPLPSENVQVPAQKYAREISAKGGFVRVGISGITIPKSSIAFDPPILPPGTGMFRVVLKDYNFTGANYTGTIVLTSTTTTVAPEERVITVGL